MQIDDVSPTMALKTEILISPTDQSISGKALCIAVSYDGTRVYLGGHSGVWISEDGGITFYQVQKPQPEINGVVPGAIPVPNIFDLLISPINNDIVLAATGRDLRANDRVGPIKNMSGIYKSVDGG